MGSEPHVTIVVLNWNGLDDTLVCLDSLAQLDYPAYDVVVVDNGSTDNSVSAIRVDCPNVVVVEAGENLGYTGGNNVGIRYMLNHGGDYAFLLNNDTTVHPQMLGKLVHFAESNPRVGIVGPKQLFFYEPNVIVGSGSVIDWRGGTIRHRRRGKVETESESATCDSPQRVDFMDGCAVCVRREFIEKVGILDERFFLTGFEDADWGMRAAAHGYEVWNVPDAKMWHKISAITGIGSPLVTYYWTRNSLLFFWENSPGHWRWLCTFRIILRTVRTIGAWTLKPDYRTDTFRRKRAANLLAMRDFFLGRFGQMGPDVARVCLS